MLTNIHASSNKHKHTHIYASWNLNIPIFNIYESSNRNRNPNLRDFQSVTFWCNHNQIAKQSSGLIWSFKTEEKWVRWLRGPGLGGGWGPGYWGAQRGRGRRTSSWIMVITNTLFDKLHYGTYLFDWIACKGWNSQNGIPSRNIPRSVWGKQWANTAVLSLQSTCHRIEISLLECYYHTSIPVLQWYGDTILYWVNTK